MTRSSATFVWIRDQLGHSNFGIDLVLPSRSPSSAGPDELLAEIPCRPSATSPERSAEKYDVPEPQNDVALRKWSGLNQKIAQRQIDTLLDAQDPGDRDRVSVRPIFSSRRSHERGMRLDRPDRCDQAGPCVRSSAAPTWSSPRATTPPATPAVSAHSRSCPRWWRRLGDVPVIAAGGITTGRHLAATLCLGAAGVWAGTVWLASQESDVDPGRQGAHPASEWRRDDAHGLHLGQDHASSRACPWTEEWEREDAPAVLEEPVPDAAHQQLSAGRQRRAPPRPDDRGRGAGRELRDPTSARGRRSCADLADEARVCARWASRAERGRTASARVDVALNRRRVSVSGLE